MKGTRKCEGVVKGTGLKCQKPSQIGKNVCFYHDPDAENRCTATTQDGFPCTKYAMKNDTVCEAHQGRLSLRQVRLRLEDMRPAALSALQRALECGEWPVVIAAVRLVFDRTGLGPNATLTIDDKSQDLSKLTHEELQARAQFVYTALEAAKRHDEQQNPPNQPVLDGETLSPGDEGPVH